MTTSAPPKLRHGLAWHIHHLRLLELLTEPIESRQKFIRDEKAEGEQVLRLRLLQHIKGELPHDLIVAYENYDVADGTYREATLSLRTTDVQFDNCCIAGRQLEKMLDQHQSEVEALHAIECSDCPWDGKTIFPETTP